MYNPLMKPARQTNLDTAGRQYNETRRVQDGNRYALYKINIGLTPGQESRYAFYNPVRTGLRTREAYDLNGTTEGITPADWFKVGLVAAIIAGGIAIAKGKTRV